MSDKKNELKRQLRRAQALERFWLNFATDRLEQQNEDRAERKVMETKVKHLEARLAKHELAEEPQS